LISACQIPFLRVSQNMTEFAIFAHAKFRDLTPILRFFARFGFIWQQFPGNV
jgi:hypothetical protein